mgnify:FL=1
MKLDCSFDSEADSDAETEIEIIEKPEQPIENINIIKSIFKSLTKILDNNKNLPNYKKILVKQSKMCFSSKSLPEISLYEYLIRIQKYSLVEKNTLILALIYIDRLCKIGKILLTNYNIYRILFSALILAIKYNEDKYFDNEYYSQIAGIKMDELKNIEYNFLSLCDFNVFVDEETFEKYSRNLHNLNDDNEDELNSKIMGLYV